MGSGVRRGVGASPPSHVTYYVAMGGIVGLLLLLCFYFFYFFAKRVKELSSQESPLQSPAQTQGRPLPLPSTTPVTAPYPVQPGIRESATAMAKLCKQLPPPSAGKGGTVFPTSTSPAALHTDTGPAPRIDKTRAPDRHPPLPLTNTGVTEVPPAR